MTDDPFARLGTRLRQDLDAAVGEPPPVARLRRRRTTRLAVGTAALLAAVGIVLVLTPGFIGSPWEVTIDPVAPPEEDQPAPDEDPPGTPEAPGSDEGSPEDIEVRPLDVEGEVPIQVLAIGFDRGTSLALIDLDPGQVSVYPQGVHGLSREPVGGALLTDVGLVVWQADASVSVFSDGLVEPSLVHLPADLETSTAEGSAPSITAMPTHDGRGLWVVQTGGCCSDVRPGQVERVDLRTGEVLDTVELPPNSRPIATARDGLLLNTLRFEETDDGWTDEPGSHRVLFLDEASGSVVELADGEALAATDDQAAVLVCEHHAARRECRLDLVTLVTREHVEVAAPAEGVWDPVAGSNLPTNTPPWAAASRDGRILVGLVGDTSDVDDPHVRTRHLVVIDTLAPAGPTAEVVYEMDGKHLAAAWDRDGRHIVVSDSLGSDLIVLDPEDGSTFMVRDAIPEAHYLLGMGWSGMG